MKWCQAKSIILKNEAVKNELKLNEAEYKNIEEIIIDRKGKNTRFESGNYNPSFSLKNTPRS
jgi:23S rRNA A1618 N6-methylase RlmF